MLQRPTIGVALNLSQLRSKRMFGLPEVLEPRFAITRKPIPNFVLP